MAGQGILAAGPPVLPLWFTIIRVAIIVLSFGVLVAAAYHLSLYGNNYYIAGNSGPAGFLIFDSIFSWIVLGIMIGFEFALPKFYFRVGFIAALGLLAIFWLSAWAWGASWSSIFLDYDGVESKEGSSLAAATALGAFAWVLTVVTLVFFVIFSVRAGPENSTNSAELGNVNHTNTAEQKPFDNNQQPVQQQQQYQQQPYDQQQPQQYQQQQPYDQQQPQQYQQQPYDQQQPQQYQQQQQYPIQTTVPPQ